MVLCVLLAFRLARHLVEPINQIDLDRPMVDETYAEPVSYTHLDVYKRQRWPWRSI